MGDNYKIADLHQGTLAVDFRGQLALDYHEHLIAILVILRFLAGGLSGPKFHHSNLTTLGSFQDFEPLGFSKYVQVAYRSPVSLAGRSNDCSLVRRLYVVPPSFSSMR